MRKVAVIGAGVIGLGCAVRMKEKYPDFEVIIITEDLSPNTTGDGAAGLWGPYVLGTTPVSKIVDWGRETHELFYKLWREGIAGSCLIPYLHIDKSSIPLPEWKNVVYGFHNLNESELELCKKNFLMDDIKFAYMYTTFTCEPKLLLKYLMSRFEKLGGKVIIQKVFTLDKFLNEDYDIVINCTGLNSMNIVPDSKMYPVRGQVIRVKAPWIYHVLSSDVEKENYYIIPNTDTIVLGGTHQINNFSTNISPEDSKLIRENCEKLIPGLKNVTTLFEWAGLRPAREGICLERSHKGLKINDREKIVVHNYGHGGSGVTLFWGCAKEVVDIITKALKEDLFCKL